MRIPLRGSSRPERAQRPGATGVHERFHDQRRGREQLPAAVLPGSFAMTRNALRRESTIDILGAQAWAGSARGPCRLSRRRILVYPAFSTCVGRKRRKGVRDRFSLSGFETGWHVMGLAGQHDVH